MRSTVQISWGGSIFRENDLLGIFTTHSRGHQAVSRGPHSRNSQLLEDRIIFPFLKNIKMECY